MKIGRRPLFFAGLAAICLILLEPTPAAYRWVNLSAAGLALVLAVLLFIEDRSVSRTAPGRRDPDS
jgi:hypothetical protein